MRPDASPFSVAKALAVTAAMRFDGTSTPVPSRMREVLSAAAAIDTKQSAVIICVSKNQACVKPSASAFCAIFHESLALGMPTPKSIYVLFLTQIPARLLHRQRPRNNDYSALETIERSKLGSDLPRET